MAGRVGRLGRARARVQGNLHYCEANSDVAPIKPRGAAWRGAAAPDDETSRRRGVPWGFLGRRHPIGALAGGRDQLVVASHGRGAETLDHYENVLIIGLHIVRLLAE